VEFADLLGPHTLAARKGTAADQRVDLLTTVMHEMGHVLGYADTRLDDLMGATLPLGARRTLTFTGLMPARSADPESVDLLFAKIGA
jgi:hypothetical protein